jgi:hypothetical protein
MNVSPARLVPPARERPVVPGDGQHLTDEELAGYTNDVVIPMAGFLGTLFVGWALTAFVVVPLRVPFVPSLATPILECAGAATADVTCEGVGPRILLVLALTVSLSVGWLNGYQYRLRPWLAAHGVVPDPAGE